MKVTRRGFNASVLTGAAALACGTIVAGGDAEPKEEERGTGLKVGDEVMYSYGAEFGVGKVVELYLYCEAVAVLFPSRRETGLLMRKELVRILHSPWKEGDRLIGKSKETWRSGRVSDGTWRLGKVYDLDSYKKWGLVSIEFDPDDRFSAQKFVYSIPSNGDIHKIQELV